MPTTASIRERDYAGIVGVSSVRSLYMLALLSGASSTSPISLFGVKCRVLWLIHRVNLRSL